jgi:hypothetical protein
MARNCSKVDLRSLILAESAYATSDVPTRDVEAQTIGENSAQRVKAGTAGTVVLVYSELGAVAAYEVEFPLGAGQAALATIPSSYVRRCVPGYPADWNARRASIVHVLTGPYGVRVLSIHAIDSFFGQQDLKAMKDRR